MVGKKLLIRELKKTFANFKPEILSLLMILVALLLAFSIPAAKNVAIQRGAEEEPFVPCDGKADNRGCQIAVKNILDWLQTMKDEKGVYYYGYQCGKTCNSPLEDNRVGIAALWGIARYYGWTRDPNVLKIIDSGLDVYLDESKVNVIQNEFWHCKLLYDIWLTDGFSDSEREKIANLCQRADALSKEFGEVENSVAGLSASKLPPSELNLEKAVREEQLAEKIAYVKENFASEAVFASEFAVKYDWFKNKKDLLRSLTYFSKAVKAYFTEAETGQQPKNLAILGVAALDLFKTTHKTQYLNFATSLADKLNQKECTNLEECVLSAVFYKELFGISANLNYRSMAESKLLRVMTLGFDAKEYSGYLLGKGAVREFSSAGDFWYLTNLNGLVLGLLTD